jgi:8-oxo-dGTP diphosphatase
MELKKGQDYIGVGVGAVILQHEHILLLQRLKEPEAGCWGIAGGAVEFGETIEAAIVREVREELAIEAQIITLLGVTNHILPMANVHWIAPIFLMKITAGTPENLEPTKHREIQWFNLKKLPENITLPTQDAIQFLHNRLDGSEILL